MTGRDDARDTQSRLGAMAQAVQERVHLDHVGLPHARVEGVTHAVQERVGAALETVTEALHGASEAAHRLGARFSPAEPETPSSLVPSGSVIVRPKRGSRTFLAWRDGRWAPVHREHGVGWVWSA